MTNDPIGILIPTFQAAKHLPHCLPPLLHSPLKPKILLIDSSSTDETIEIARSFDIESIIIPRHEFNHGTTREKGRKLLGTPIVVMMTQDAYPKSSDMLEYLVQPLLENWASIAYARQLPYPHATLFEAFSRKFNYPKESHIRGMNDLSTYGVYTFFCSNSCAAYLNSALDEIGGFPATSFGEDTIVTAKLLQNNHRIAYVAEAQVYHSHNYTLKQEFKRHFEMGCERKKYASLLKGGESTRGKAYIKALFKEIWQQVPHMLPYAFCHVTAKWLGYKLGELCKMSNLRKHSA